jgi:low affinity Fe/Cu permease
MATRKKGLSRRMKILLSVLAVSVVIGVMIAYDQISILYILTSVALIVLLLIVGFSDLEKVGRMDDQEA